MRTLKKITLIASLLSFSFPIFSQQKDSVPEAIKAPVEVPDPKDVKAHDKPPMIVNENESKLVTDMYSANLFEIRLAQQAKNKASGDEVKEFAALMDKDHTAMNTELSAIAALKNIVLPDTLITKKREIINNLIKETGKAYDMAYMALMVKKHQDVIDMSESAVKTCSDMDIRKWFEAALPSLREHLDKAKHIGEKLSVEVD